MESVTIGVVEKDQDLSHDHVEVCLAVFLLQTQDDMVDQVGVSGEDCLPQGLHNGELLLATPGSLPELLVLA